MKTVQRGVVALTPRGVFTRRGVTKDSVRRALAAVADIDLGADLARSAVPPYVVIGSRDRSAALAEAEISRRAPGATTKVIDGAGQDLLGDAGPALGQIIAEWLSRP